MQLPSHPSLPKRLRRPLAIGAISIVAITLLVVVFYFIAQPYVASQLGSVEDRRSGRLVYKVPSRLADDRSLIPRLFGGTESSDMVARAATWSWRETGATDTIDNLLFSMGYSYVEARGAIPSDRTSVITQLKQSSQASIVSRIQTITGCRDSPGVTLSDFSPAGTKGFSYDYSCTDRRGAKLHGTASFLLVDDSNELHLLIMLGREDIWQNNRSRITTMMNEIKVAK
ncbi:MAG: hypothetical protein WAZ21_02255 [Candidatus Saccharimonadales bacterium]